eukprot:gene9189-14252_t
MGNCDGKEAAQKYNDWPGVGGDAAGGKPRKLSVRPEGYCQLATPPQPPRQVPPPQAAPPPRCASFKRIDHSLRPVVHPVDPPVVGGEVIVYEAGAGITGSYTLAASLYKGCRGKVVSLEPGGGAVVAVAGKTESFQPSALLARQHEVAACYCGPLEVRWFRSVRNELVQWTRTPNGKEQAVAVRSLSFRHADRMLRDENGLGCKLPAADWRRVVTVLAPAADLCNVAHNLPTREIRPKGWWKPGSGVVALWEGAWHTGSVAKAHADGKVDVFWDEDATLTPGVPPLHVRPWMRKECAVDLPEAVVEPALLRNPHLDFDHVYTAGKKLGEGGFGQVYEVTHKATGKKYAAKILPVSHDTKDEVREVVTTRAEGVAVGSKIQGLCFEDLGPQEDPAVLSSPTEPPSPSGKGNRAAAGDGKARRASLPATQNGSGTLLKKWLAGRPISGFVVYTGPSPYGSSGYVGVVLDLPCGRHNGTVDGVWYFDAPANRGAFMKATMCRPVRPHVTEVWGGLSHPNLCTLVDWRAGRQCFSPCGNPDWGEEEVYGAESDNYMVCVMEHAPGGDLENVLKKNPQYVGDGEVGGGTLLYMAPELLLAWRWRPGVQWSPRWKAVAEKFGVKRDLAQEAPSYNQKIDIFAAGVVCFNLLTKGKLHPFKLDGSWESLPEATHLCHLAESIVEGVVFPDIPWGKVSSSCKDFISWMLEANACSRPTAAEALAHPWLTKNVPQAGHQSARDSNDLSGNDDVVTPMEMGSLLAKMKDLRLREPVRGKGPPKGVPTWLKDRVPIQRPNGSPMTHGPGSGSGVVHSTAIQRPNGSPVTHGPGSGSVIQRPNGSPMTHGPGSGSGVMHSTVNGSANNESVVRHAAGGCVSPRLLAFGKSPTGRQPRVQSLKGTPVRRTGNAAGNFPGPQV